MTAQLVAFLGVAAVVICTPGQDTALTIRTTLAGGRSAGVATATGVVLAQLAWTVAAAVGVASLIAASRPAFVALQLAGAAFLVLLGVQSLLRAWRGRVSATAAGSGAAPSSHAFRQGLVSNLANPKMAVFFTSLLPQFAPEGALALPAMLALGLLFAALTLAWLSGYALLVSRARHVLVRPPVQRLLDAVTGAVLCAFGVRLAAHRPG